MKAPVDDALGQVTSLLMVSTNSFVSLINRTLKIMLQNSEISL